jgi:hypothetical protein
MSRFPASARSLSNRIFVPSGDQAGFSSVPGADVSRRRPEPSSFTTQMSFDPPRSEVNATSLPSGAHAGSAL